MSERPLIERLTNAKSALESTVKTILDLNRKLKTLHLSKKAPENTEIKSELKLLNKVANQQSKIVRMYQDKLNQRFGN